MRTINIVMLVIGMLIGVNLQKNNSLKMRTAK